MTKVNITVSNLVDNFLIPINDLKTVETAVHKRLGMDVLHPQMKDQLSSDILFHWQEAINDDKRHCVKPLVHVLISERLTEMVAGNMKDPFMPFVVPAESTPRSMDWILVLHFDAFKRPQEMAFSESRKLLKAGPGIVEFIEERAEIEMLDTIGPNVCYGLFRDVLPDPAPFGDKAPAEWKTATIARSGMTMRVMQANALQRFAAQPLAIEAGGVDQAIAAVGVAEERIRKLCGSERLFLIRPTDNDDLRMHVLQCSGRDVLEAMRIAKFADLIVAFTQDGQLRFVCDPEGHEVDTAVGVGAEIADAANNAGKRIAGDGIDSYPGTKVAIAPKLIYLTPVGSQLRAEFAELERLVIKLRPMEGFADIPMVNYLGRKECLHYPPYQDFVKKIMGDGISEAAQQQGLVIVTLQDDFSKLSGITDKVGKMIATERGLGNSIATAFGGLIGQPVRK